MKQAYFITAQKALDEYGIDLAFLDQKMLIKIQKIHSAKANPDQEIIKAVRDFIQAKSKKVNYDKSSTKVSITESENSTKTFALVGRLDLLIEMQIKAGNLEEALEKVMQFNQNDFVRYINPSFPLLSSNFTIHDLIE